MFVTYEVPGQPRREWELDIDDLPEADAEKIERQYRRATGEKLATYDMFRIGLYQGSASARRLLLWYLEQLDHPTLRFEDTPNFRRKQLKVEMSRGEYESLRETLVAKMPPGPDLDETLAFIDMELKTARDSATGAELDETEGKA